MGLQQTALAGGLQRRFRLATGPPEELELIVVVVDGVLDITQIALHAVDQGEELDVLFGRGLLGGRLGGDRGVFGLGVVVDQICQIVRPDWCRREEGMMVAIRGLQTADHRLGQCHSLRFALWKSCHNLFLQKRVYDLGFRH